jgi:hypothetical protein
VALIGFDPGDEHVLCERCSADTPCCELIPESCGACAGSGLAWDGSGRCEQCGGHGWWFTECGCDENGQHRARPTQMQERGA